MTELNSSLCKLNWLIAKGGSAPEETPPESLEKSSKTSSPRLPMCRDDEKPPLSYSQLIRMAIENSSNQQCTLNGIYKFVAESFPYYRDNRNSSWRNSIRHNLSLNKQFKRLDKREGEKGCLWVCVAPPEKRPRVMGGSPPRVNPVVQRYYQKGRQSSVESATQQPLHVIIPAEISCPISDVSTTPNSNFSTMSSQTTSSAYFEIPLTGPVSVFDVQLTSTEMETDDDISDLNLFASHDLSASFRNVYNQIFQKKTSQDARQREAQIDWLKISLETAGVDYTNEEELFNVDTDRFQEYIANGFPEYPSEQSTPRTYEFTQRLSSDISLTELNTSMSGKPTTEKNTEEEFDEFDWNSIV